MILPSMTYKEMYDHLAADKQKVDIKKDYLLHKAIKNFRKTSRFPAWELYEYKIPTTNNQYIIYFYAENRTRVDKPEVGSFCILFNGKQRLAIKWGAGGVCCENTVWMTVFAIVRLMRVWPLVACLQEPATNQCVQLCFHVKVVSDT